MASGLSMPVGLRAPAATCGGVEDVALARASLSAAAEARHFLGVTAHGLAGIVESTGNADCSLMLGGGLGGGPGSGAQRAQKVLAECAAESGAAVVAECGSGGAIDSDQIQMASAIAAAISANKPAPKGVSVHSYLLAGSQKKTESLVHGLSVTDPCMDWMATEQVVRMVADAVKARRALATGNGGKKRGRGN